MAFLQVLFELADELLLDVEHASADLADRVLVVAARQLVVRRTFTEVRGIHRPRRRQRFQRAIDGAALESRLGFVQLSCDLVRGAVASEPNDGLVNHRPLCGAPHPGREHQLPRMTRSERSDLVSTRHPRPSTTTSSSIRTPPQPAM